MFSLVFLTMVFTPRGLIVDPETCCQSEVFAKTEDDPNVFCTSRDFRVARASFKYKICPIDLSEQTFLQRRFLKALDSQPYSGHAYVMQARQEVFHVLQTYTKLHTGEDLRTQHTETMMGDSIPPIPHLILGIEHGWGDLVDRDLHATVDSLFAQLNAVALKNRKTILIVTELSRPESPDSFCSRASQKYRSLRFVLGEPQFRGSAEMDGSLYYFSDLRVPGLRATGNRNYAMLETASQAIKEEPGIIGVVFIHGGNHLAFYQPHATGDSTAIQFNTLKLVENGITVESGYSVYAQKVPNAHRGDLANVTSQQQAMAALRQTHSQRPFDHMLMPFSGKSRFQKPYR